MLERIGVPYFVGGSLASSLQGEPRATNDIDLVVDLAPSAVGALREALGPDFEVDEEALADAVRRRGSWNIFFLPLTYKIDLFQKGTTPFDESEFSRRRRFDLGAGRHIWLESPEDSALRKLLWYRQGGEVATHQWRDVVQLLRTSPRLDERYLDEWAAALGIADLLAKARAEAFAPA